MNGNNATNEEPLNGSPTVLQSVETRHEENVAWQGSTATRDAVKSGPLPWLNEEEIEDLQSRWNSIQVEFVDEPRTSAEQATALVAEALKRIEQSCSNQRTIIDNQWVNQEDVTTEDLRIALQNYRSFLNRLLAL